MRKASMLDALIDHTLLPYKLLVSYDRPGETDH